LFTKLNPVMLKTSEGAVTLGALRGDPSVDLEIA
jgi:hypothetical protein